MAARRMYGVTTPRTLGGDNDEGEFYELEDALKHATSLARESWGKPPEITPYKELGQTVDIRDAATGVRLMFLNIRRDGLLNCHLYSNKNGATQEEYKLMRCWECAYDYAVELGELEIRTADEE